MTRMRPLDSRPLPSPRSPEPGKDQRHAYRERDFGVGYGRSSGYAAARRYASAWTGAPRFRCG